MAIDKQRFFQFNGFDEDGRATIIYGDTMPVKDELKKMGAKFNGNLRRWIMPGRFTSPFPHTGTEPVEADDLFVNYDYRYPNEKGIEMFRDIISRREAFLYADMNRYNPSTFVGNVGDRITVDVTLLTFKGEGVGSFGYYYRYEVLGTDNNIYTFNSSKPINEKVSKLTGTITRHNEYKSIKSTVLNRVKVVE